MTNAKSPPGVPAVLDNGIYAVHPPLPETAHAVDPWDKGGGISGSRNLLPAGMSMRLVREYRVGQYVYQDFALALAELRRQNRGDAGNGDA